MALLIAEEGDSRTEFSEKTGGVVLLDCIYPHQTNHDFLASFGFSLTEHAAIAAVL